MKIKLFKYTIRDAVNGFVFETQPMSIPLLGNGAEKFISPVTIAENAHVSVYINKPEACEVLGVQEFEIDVPEFIPRQITASVVEESQGLIADAPHVEVIEEAQIVEPKVEEPVIG